MSDLEFDPDNWGILVYRHDGIGGFIAMPAGKTQVEQQIRIQVTAARNTSYPVQVYRSEFGRPENRRITGKSLIWRMPSYRQGPVKPGYADE